MSQNKSRYPKMVALQAHFHRAESILVLSNGRGGVVASLKLPELAAHLRRGGVLKSSPR